MPETSLRCPVCGSPTRHYGEKNGYVIRRCPRCGHGFVHDVPPPEVLIAHYEYERGLRYIRPFVGSVLDSVVHRFEPFRCSGRLLDVGFGAGAMLLAAERAGWQTFGIEIAHAPVAAATAAGVKAELVEGNMLTHPYEPASFDVVIFDGIVANLPRPWDFFRRAHEILRRGGLLYVTTPHGRGLSARILGIEWSAWAPPEHLHMFSRRSVTLAVSHAGFSTSRTYTRGFNPYTILRPLGRAGSIPRPVDVNASLVRTGPGRALKRAANAVLRLTSLGDQLYLEAVG